MAKELRIAPNLTLPLDAVTQRFAFLGRIGSGKTYTATKLLELMLEAHAQVVAIDPVGKCYGLRVPGKGPAFDIPIFGGLHGDIPLEPTGGALIADLVVDRTLSCIIDVSQFATDADKARFAAAFGERFFFRKKSSPSAVHVFLEECQEFVPQNPAKGEEMMLHHWTRLAKLGRNFGIGLSLASQRPQEVNKKVLNLTECLFAFQLRGKHERDAVKDWITSKDSDKAILDELPKLAVGDAIVDSPQWLGTTKRVRVYEKRTADVSATPKVGEQPASERPLTEVDIANVRQAMAATIERAKADDPKALKLAIAERDREIGKLQVQLNRETSKVASATATKGELAAEFKRGFGEGESSGRVAAMRDLKRVIGKDLGALGSSIDKVKAFAGRIDQQLADVVVAFLRLDGTLSPNGELAPTPAAAVARTPSPRPVVDRPVARRPVVEGDGDLSKGEKTILIAIAQYPDGAEREQLTVLTGYKRSSRDTYIQRLGAKGYVETIAGGAVRATDTGIDALGSDYEPLPTGVALQEYWLDRLGGGEKKILEVLIAAGGEPVSRDEITEQTEYLRSSRDTYLQRLSSRRLVESVGRGEVRASATLFE